MDRFRIRICFFTSNTHRKFAMSLARTLKYISTLLFLLSSRMACGVEIDVQPGLTGSWYDPRTSGQGFMLVVYGDTLYGHHLALASWFTYDDVVGGAEHQRWYTLSGPIVRGETRVSMTIYQNTGGNFNALPATTALPVGTATLSFDSCTSGQLVYNFTDGSDRASTIPLTRLTQNVTCSTTLPRPTADDFWRSDEYYDRAKSGQGLTVEVNPISEVLFFAWTTYAPNGADAGPAGQRWYTGQGRFAAGSFSIPIQLYETTGGLFDDGTATPRTVVVGSGALAFAGCTATLTFNFTGGSSMGASGTISVDSVNPSGQGCWDY
jgi:hypothetical protein